MLSGEAEELLCSSQFATDVPAPLLVLIRQERREFLEEAVQLVFGVREVQCYQA